MQAVGCVAWFEDFIRYHQRLHPSQLWPSLDDVEEIEFYEGWIEELDRIRATHELARWASRRLQAIERRYLPFEQLPVVSRLICDGARTGAYDRDRARTAGETAARAASRDCPECNGSGMASRRVRVQFRPSGFPVDLYCRCSYGRSLISQAIALGAVCTDDLQARPELWRDDVSHATWSNEPSVSTVPFDGEYL